MPKFNLKDVTTPVQGLVVYKDAYWLCADGDTKKALFYGDAPQCNKDKRILEWSLKSKSYTTMGDLQIVFIETAFVPQRN